VSINLLKYNIYRERVSLHDKILGGFGITIHLNRNLYIVQTNEVFICF